MATRTDGETNGCIFQWKIENISHCWKEFGENIKSPTFIADGLEGTKWSLQLYPMANVIEDEIDLYVNREEDCSGPDIIEVRYQIAFLGKGGKFLKIGGPFTDVFKKNHSEYSIFESREKIFVTEREEFLPENTLTVQCTLQKKEATLVKSKHISARTIFTVNQRSFVWKIDDFSNLEPGVRNKFKDDVMDIDLVLTVGLDFEAKLVMDGISFDKSLKYLSFKTAVINFEEKKEHYGNHEYFDADLKNGISFALLFPRMLREDKNRYLPNDILSLYFEYLYSTGTVSYQFCSCGIVSPALMKVPEEERKDHCMEQPNTQITTVLANDLESIYKDGVFSDTELRTSTKTFLAHKCILIARSPVFRRMLTIDMKEKNSGHVDISDLEDDTVHGMLLYMYTDTLVDLQLENACKLYGAADKYEILSLRSRCSSLLKDNLNTYKACDVLILADLHHDDDLKSAVQDFILRHDKEVFGSQEWRQFMDTNSKLAAEVMFRKVFPG